jgi:hypothetical protein
MNIIQHPSDLVTVKKFVQITGISIAQTWRYIIAGRITPYKPGKKITLIKLSEFYEDFGDLSTSMKRSTRVERSPKESTKAQVSKKKSKKVIA